jgi:hypothetical protein
VEPGFPGLGAAAGVANQLDGQTASAAGMATGEAEPPSRKSSGSVVAQVLALSGQLPRTVDSIPPVVPAPQTVPAEAAPGNAAESLVPGAGTQVRALGAGTADRDEVAFALQVKPILTPEAAAEGQTHASLPDGPDHTSARTGREHRPDEAPVEGNGPGAGATAGKTIPQASPDAQVRAEPAPQRPPAADAKPVRPQDAMDRAAEPEALKAPLARDLKFEVTGGQQRVEVRLSERAGEVRMTVRTADEPLADTLRENLPALSARLAESGFKSEAWHPAASSTDELRHTAESAARGASHDANRDADAQPRQQDREPPDGGAQRRPKSPQETAPQKEKGKDFPWLISSLR